MKIDNFSQKWLNFPTLEVSNFQMRRFADYFTMLEWREREHEGTENADMNDPATMRLLRNYGLYKFQAIQGIRAQVEVMTWLVNKWDVQNQCFIIGDHRLELELKDIYFLTGLSKRGENISLFGARHSDLPVASYKQ